METEYPMPQTFDDAVFWLEISGYELLGRDRTQYKIKAPNGDIFYTGRLRMIESAKRIWYNFYNISEVRAYNP